MRLIALDSGVIALALVLNISRLSIYCYRWCRPTTGKHGKLTEMSRFLSPKLYKKAVLSQRWPRDREPLRRYGHSKLSKI